MPVVALTGTLGKGAQNVYDIGIDAIASIVPIPMSLEQAIEAGERLLVEATERLIRTLLLGSLYSITGALIILALLATIISVFTS